MLNKSEGDSRRRTSSSLEAMTTQARHGAAERAVHRAHESARASRRSSSSTWSPTSPSDIELGSLLPKVMSEATRMLNAERSTLFLNDEKTGELLSRVGHGRIDGEIRLPNHLGIAGAVFTSGKTINIPLRLRRPALQPRVRQADRLLHPLDPVRADRQQGRQDHRRHPGAEQARRPVHRRGRAAAEGVHRADRHRARERQAVRRRAEHEELQREHAAEHVERRHHARTKTATIVTCNAAGCASCGREAEDIVEAKAARDFFDGPNAWVLEQVAARRARPRARGHDGCARSTLGGEQRVGQPDRCCR